MIRIRELELDDIREVKLWLNDPIFRSEIGCYVVPDERRKNIATKALSDLVDYVFKNYRVLRIEAGTSSLNISSQRLLEKVGFTKEAVRKKTLFRNGKWEDSDLYEFVKEEP